MVGKVTKLLHYGPASLTEFYDVTIFGTSLVRAFILVKRNRMIFPPCGLPANNADMDYANVQSL